MRVGQDPDCICDLHLFAERIPPSYSHKCHLRVYQPRWSLELELTSPCPPADRQVYLDTVLAHPLLSQCLAVKRFLDPPNYPDSMEGKTSRVGAEGQMCVRCVRCVRCVSVLCQMCTMCSASSSGCIVSPVSGSVSVSVPDPPLFSVWLWALLIHERTQSGSVLHRRRMYPPPSPSRLRTSSPIPGSYSAARLSPLSSAHSLTIPASLRPLPGQP